MTPPIPPPYRKKMIEVALPLEAINKASAREKSIRHGHPSTLHLWWARRPLAACRAVIFSSLVDDPSSWPEIFPTEEEQEQERQRIFRIIEELVIWENSNNPRVLLKAHTEIARSLARGRNEPLPEGAEAIRAYIAEHAPPVYDPFCGGGSIPLEAQRLGLKAYGSDLNPVAVLITKALIEIPSKFAGMPPVNPESRKNKKIDGGWEGAKGLAEDVRYYGQWMRDEAEKRIGHLYPKMKITEEMAKDRPDLVQYVGQELTVIAWLWARTVKSPNPAVGGAEVPLIKSYWLSKKKGNIAWIIPEVDKKSLSYKFTVMTGEPETFDPNNGTIARNGAKCLLSDEPISLEYIRFEGKSERIGKKLIALVAEGRRGRVFLNPEEKFDIPIDKGFSQNFPETDIPEHALGFSVQLYGFNKHYKLFTDRQLVALTVFSDIILELDKKIKSDYNDSIRKIDYKNWFHDLEKVTDYSKIVSTYLGLAISKATDLSSIFSHWQPNPDHLKIAPTFSRPALSMTWDYAEGNPFSKSSGNFARQWELISDVIENLIADNPGIVIHKEAQNLNCDKIYPMISTDPPYYDNIPYADLSDFFYIWLRRTVGSFYPELFSTLLTPKNSELIADPYRRGSKEKSKAFFETGLNKVFNSVYNNFNIYYPLSVYYAFKQIELDSPDNKDTQMASTGWETILNSLISTNFSITGTWPFRTERTGRLREVSSNALASSIVLVCRPRPDDAKTVTRREFLSALKKELPQALHNLQQGLIAPVDLAQAAIGPGMAVFTRYAKVMESDGSAMTVRTALGIINQILDEVLAEQEGEFDTDTRWAVAWFEQHGMEEGPYGEAETLAVAKNISVQGIVDAGILTARGGKAKLISRNEYPDDWDPATDTRLPVWEATQHLIRTLESQGESGAADLLNKLGGTIGDQTRDLAYRLYAICERKKWSAEAMAYNGLIISWPEISKLAQGSLGGTTGQQTLM